MYTESTMYGTRNNKTRKFAPSLSQNYRTWCTSRHSVLEILTVVDSETLVTGSFPRLKSKSFFVPTLERLCDPQMKESKLPQFIFRYLLFFFRSSLVFKSNLFFRSSLFFASSFFFTSSLFFGSSLFFTSSFSPGPVSSSGAISSPGAVALFIGGVFKSGGNTSPEAITSSKVTVSPESSRRERIECCLSGLILSVMSREVAAASDSGEGTSFLVTSTGSSTGVVIRDVVLACRRLHC